MHLRYRRWGYNEDGTSRHERQLLLGDDGRAANICGAVLHIAYFILGPGWWLILHFNL